MIHPKTRQNLLDIALEHCGNAEAAWEVASLNGMSMTDDVDVDSLVLPMVVDSRHVTSYQVLHHSPATNMTNTEIENLVGVGIGFMSIEGNFIVY